MPNGAEVTSREGPRGLLAAPLFSYGFRLFFLCAGVYGALSMGAWLLWIGLHAGNLQVRQLSIALPPYLWHGHEMLFGYGMAVLAGFLLTAVPSWTGSRPVMGGTLALLGLSWIAARLANWGSAMLSPYAVAALDLLFILILGILIARSLLSSPSRRNLIFPPMLLVMLIANLLAHLELTGATSDTLQVGHRLALNAFLVLLTVIGGRIVPAFTGNALQREGVERLPVSRKPLEIGALGSMILLLLVDLVQPGSLLAGVIAAVAAIANGLRMTGWRSLNTRRQPILWILHLGYAWLVAGLALKALALLSDTLSETTAIHALTVGAIGSMTLAVMTRAGLGHTGRALVAPRPIVAAYVLITLAGLLRVVGPALVPILYNEAILLSGLAWVAAFTLFSLVYWPIFTRAPERAQSPAL